jgi:glutathione S-transferase
MKLLVANKNYSSWSLRAWLLLRHADIPFAEETLGFNAPDFKESVRRVSPAGRVPVLIDGDLVVWDSLAIAEYVAEKFPEKKLWPEERTARARARSMCAEMHAGFAAMRSRMPMNCELVLKNMLFDVDVQRDVERVVEMWSDCRGCHAAHGPFLFGRFSIADAYYAPVALRFVSYGTRLPDVARHYVATITGLPAMEEWLAAARAECDFFAEDEPYRTHR